MYIYILCCLPLVCSLFRSLFLLVRMSIEHVCERVRVRLLVYLSFYFITSIQMSSIDFITLSCVHALARVYTGKANKIQ